MSNSAGPFVSFTVGPRPSQAKRRGSSHRVAPTGPSQVEPLESRRLMSVNVTTYHYDNARDGANTQETTLTPGNVNSTTFGKVASLPVDGQIYAQPLVMTNIAVTGQGTHNIVLVATEADDVYAFDAAGNNPAKGYLWRTSLLKTGETTVPESDYGSSDITPQIGITGTPVIDPATNTLYVVGAFKESDGTYQQRIYALDITSGAVKFGGPVVISATVAGKGSAEVNDQVSFSAFRQNQRPALTLANGEVYVAWSSHADQNPFHGWVMAYNAATLKQDAVYNDSPNGGEGGIWMAGGGIAVDASGNLYFTTGNGTFDVNNGGSDYSMALEKLSPTLKVEDYFTPSNEAALSNRDLDYGCSSVILLPNQPGSNPDEMISAGKWGTLYLNDSDTGKLGEFTTNGPNKDLGEANITSNTTTASNIHNTMSYWNGHVYVGGDTLPLETFSISDGKLGTSPSSETSKVFGNGSENGQGTGPTVSSNGTSNGIVWAVDDSAFYGKPAVLYAYNANNLSDLLYSSAQAANGRDTAGDANKYQDAVVANGYVYIGGANSVTVYGLLSGTTTGTGKATITTAAAATPTSVTAKTTVLTINAADTTGDAAPTYTWVASTTPSGATSPTYSVNGTSTSNSTTATFSAAGTYTFTVTATDPTSGATATSSVSVMVKQTSSGVSISPVTAAVVDGATLQFTATANDQFGHAMSTQPTFTWAVKPGGVGGTISSTGLYKAPATGAGTATVTATTGSLSATATVTAATPPPTGTSGEVSLSGYFNQVGIVTDGSKITNGGIDGSNDGLSGTLLGTSKTWDSSTFAIAAATAAGTTDNVVEGAGQTIALTPGEYDSLKLLALHINGSAKLTFTVTYTDGTTQSITQGVSDWFSPQGYAGESEAVTMAYRDKGSGVKDSRTFYVYGVNFALDSAKTVKGLTLPKDANFKLLAADLIGSSPANAAASIDYNQVGIVADGSTTSGGGIDGSGNSLSGTVLGSEQTWDGNTFAIGLVGQDNVIEAAGQKITLTGSDLSKLDLLATHINGSADDVLTVTYTDGTTQTVKQGFSDWYSPQTFAGESKAITMPYRDEASGAEDKRTFYVYGYRIALNSAKTVASLTLPADANLKVLSLGLA